MSPHELKRDHRERVQAIGVVAASAALGCHGSPDTCHGLAHQTDGPPQPGFPAGTRRSLGVGHDLPQLEEEEARCLHHVCVAASPEEPGAERELEQERPDQAAGESGS